MTTITLTPELEEVLAEQARQQAVSVEEFVLNTLRLKFLPFSLHSDTGDSLSEWEQEIHSAAEQIRPDFN